MTDARIKQYEEAYQYALRLADALMAQHFPDNKDWRPLGDLLGLLTQIDNMTTAWNRRAEPVSVQEAARVLLDSDGYLSDCAIHAACYCAEIDETRAIVALREGLRALAADKKE